MPSTSVRSVEIMITVSTFAAMALTLGAYFHGYERIDRCMLDEGDTLRMGRTMMT